MFKYKCELLYVCAQTYKPWALVNNMSTAQRYHANSRMLQIGEMGKVKGIRRDLLNS